MGGSASSRCTTHIANAYHEVICCKTAMDEASVKLKEIEGSGSAGYKGISVSGSEKEKMNYDWQYAQKNGFTTISPQSYLGFEPRGDKDIVYISIHTISGRIICDCFPIKEDYSVIVKPDGTIARTQYGSIWVDTNGARY